MTSHIELKIGETSDVEYFENGYRTCGSLKDFTKKGYELLIEEKTKSYFLDGYRHNLIGPAVIYADGGEDYYIAGIIYDKTTFDFVVKSINKAELDGYKIKHILSSSITNKGKETVVYSDAIIYHLDGARHNENGPAILKYPNYGPAILKYPNYGGAKGYYLNGTEYSKEEYDKELLNRKLKMSNNDTKNEQYEGIYKVVLSTDNVIKFSAKNYISASNTEGYKIIYYTNGSRLYTFNGLKHCAAHPAYFGDKVDNVENYLDGIYYTFQDFNNEIKRRKENTRLEFIKNGCVSMITHIINGETYRTINGILYSQQEYEMLMESKPAEPKETVGQNQKGDSQMIGQADRYEGIYKIVDKSINKGYELVITSNGNKWYYLDGQHHRENAPAVINMTDGYQAWWIHNKLHNLNGPARIWPSGNKSYYIDGKYYEEKEYHKEITKLEVEKIKVENNYDGIYKKVSIAEYWNISKGYIYCTLPNGDKGYRKNNKTHNIFGPAIIDASGLASKNGYYLDDTKYKKEDFDIEIEKRYDKAIELMMDYRLKGNEKPDFTINGTDYYEFGGIPFTEKQFTLFRAEGQEPGVLEKTTEHHNDPAVARYVKKYKKPDMENVKYEGVYRIKNHQNLTNKGYELYVYSDGTKAFLLNGKNHRLNGPAIIRSNGEKEYWIDGQVYKENDYYIETSNRQNEAIYLILNSSSLFDVVTTFSGENLSTEYYIYNSIPFTMEDLIDTRRAFVIPNGNEIDTKRSKTMSEKFVDMVKSDAQQAVYRVASSQITKGMKAAIVQLLEKQGSSSEHVKALNNLLDSEFGLSLISLMLGLGLNYVPGLSSDPRIEKLSQEFRVHGMAVAGNAVMGIAMEQFLPVITSALKNIPALPEEPATTSGVRVAPPVTQLGTTPTKLAQPQVKVPLPEEDELDVKLKALKARAT